MGKKRPKGKGNKQVEAQIESATSDSMDDNMISFTNKSQTVLMKVCRLCESKDGPFLNIFDADTVTIKKIDEIMPFVITENDDLPHKICFRCSAKVEELYEFIQKCIKTQESLRTELGKKSALYTKTKTRMLWEKKLHQSNMSNDDICNAVIKKAMEGIKDIPNNPLPVEMESPPLNKKAKANIEPPVKKESPKLINKIKETNQSDDEHDEISLKQVKLTIEKCDDKPLTRTSRSSKTDNLLEGLPEVTMKQKQYTSRKLQKKFEEAPVDKNAKDDIKQNTKPNVNIPVIAEKKSDESNKVEPTKDLEPPPINIMDHVSIIKVNGVGTLFLCKLCNRNFLKKEVVYTHGCAKNNVPKDSFLQNSVAPPQIPKPSTVKYIKMDSRDFNKPPVTENNKVQKKLVSSNIKEVNISVQPEIKLKPKAGPASKINRVTQNQTSIDPTPQKTNVASESNVPLVTPAINFPGLPSLNTRYKLVPGPNNVFTLIEDSVAQTENQSQPSEPAVVPTNFIGKKRKLPITINNTEGRTKYQSILPIDPPPSDVSAEVFDIEDDMSPPRPAVEQPYPVGLFQTVPHHSGVFAPTKPPGPPSFTTPAMKKQSYTVVQTGNPSKLLISAKPQLNTEEAPGRKKVKKLKNELRALQESDKDSHNVSIDGTGSSKNPGFFTFINVDPLLQPSYVLPTDNIIQESQISTSTPASKAVVDNKDKDNKYECNMCNEKFSREKKLLAHIQSHYNQMDEEDQIRAEKAPSHNKRKTRKS